MNQQEKRLVLMVEDNKNVHQLLEFGLRAHQDKYLLISAHTLESGQKLFRKYREHIHVVILDASLDPRCELDTIPLLEEIVASDFTGAIIASSSSRAHRQTMMRSGCTRDCEKSRLIDLLKEDSF